MGWGGRGKARGKGKDNTRNLEKEASQSSRGHFYFGSQTDEGVSVATSQLAHCPVIERSATMPVQREMNIDPEKVKQEKKLQKKLRELEALEARQSAGEKLEPLQLKKLETKATIEEELQVVRFHLRPLQEGLRQDDLADEIRLRIEDEAALEKEDKGGTSGKAAGGQGVPPKQQTTQCPSVSIRSAAAKTSAWVSPASRSVVGGGGGGGSGGGSAWGVGGRKSSNRGNAWGGGRDDSGESAKTFERCAPENKTLDLSDPGTVFDTCDNDDCGELQLHPLKFALNAFGIFLDIAEVKAELGGKTSICKDEFRAIVSRLSQTLPQEKRGPRTVPYACRGVSLEQLELLNSTFVESGWIQHKCDIFNAEKTEDIKAGTVFELQTNLYALDRFVIRPVTDTDQTIKETVPQQMREAARLPDATRKCSYSELVNPTGVSVDFFVSHWWGHSFVDTMLAIQKWANRAHQTMGIERPQDVVWWFCFLALNQHRAGDEVGSSPEEGPFNAALVRSRGAVMILDEAVQPFQRIWCLYEVSRLRALKKDLKLLCSLGPVGGMLEDSHGDPKIREEALKSALQIEKALSKVAAFSASASNENDKYAIWHRIADPRLRNKPLHQLVKDKSFNHNVFKQFDITIAGLLATPLFQAALLEKDGIAALRFLGRGAAFNGPNIDCVQEMISKIQGKHNDQTISPAEGPLSVLTVTVSVRRGTTAVSWNLLHCAAFFGHEEGVRCLIERKANIEVTTVYKMTPLNLVASTDNASMVNVLLELGANVDSRNVELRSPIHGACIMGHIGVVQSLLGSKADIVSPDKHGGTPFYAACSGGSVECVAKLLELRTDIAAKNNIDKTGLHIASSLGFQDVVGLILKHARKEGHNEKEYILAEAKRGFNAIHFAEHAGHAELARELRNRAGIVTVPPAWLAKSLPVRRNGWKSYRTCSLRNTNPRAGLQLAAKREPSCMLVEKVSQKCEQDATLREDVAIVGIDEIPLGSIASGADLKKVFDEAFVEGAELHLLNYNELITDSEEDNLVNDIVASPEWEEDIHMRALVALPQQARESFEKDVKQFQERNRVNVEVISPPEGDHDILAMRGTKEAVQASCRELSLLIDYYGLALS
eukprot:TRINITY_DN24597_c0_g1_i1.p1 TRINITY_DN24597_c0_g1~~TRINITY_DN24597_c0_g1_i1.p1  ORF type:complete len:1111 (-),score=211.21 TRINITY_DN24597_c0_g1_i1:233-3565(-)